MSYFVIDDHRAGLDRRRLKVTTRAGALIDAQDCVITRGAEIEKRKAFVSKYSLPEDDTVGLFELDGSLYVFGEAATPSGIPSGVTYQRLEHPSSSAMEELLQAEEFDGKIYAVARFVDGSVRHYYDGTEVTDWFDGAARASFSITGGTVYAGVKASSSFSITGGTVGAPNKITSITVDGVEVLGSEVAFTTDNATTAAAVAAQIASHTADPDWTAANDSAEVTITAPNAGTDMNGLAVVVTVAGDVTASSPANTAGGVVANAITGITVNGVEVLGTPVLWGTSNAATAAAVVAQIESYTSSPDYGGAQSGNSVTIVADDAGTGANGYVVAITATGDVSLSSTSATMAGGASTSSSFEPGEFVKTIQSKMYALSGTLMHFSGVNAPTVWQDDPGSPGAGFTNLASYSAKGGDLKAIETYFGDVAIIAERNVQIWNVDPDPEQNSWIQTLQNTGTQSPRSVVAFGDNDVFYLGRSGVRSLRARDSSNAAYVSDVGTSIDPYISELRETLTDAQIADAVGVMEPDDGRYWLALGSKILVFSFFPDAKVAAWTVFNAPGQVTDFAVIEGQVYMRVGDTIYLYGGDDGDTYDTTEAVATLPFMDVDVAATVKGWMGLDIACLGEWEIGTNTVLPNEEDPSQDPDYELVARVIGPTFDAGEMGMVGGSTHISLKFTSKGSGRAVLGKVVVHYNAEEAD